MKKQNPAQNRTSALANKGTHSIAKVMPKVRVVHIQAPEVIEIQPADFQKFAQSLTGKATGTKTKLTKPEFSSKDGPINLCDESSNTETESCPEHNFCTSQAKRLTPNSKNETKNPKKQFFSQNTTIALAMAKGSHSIAKMKPQVRVVHIQTPEVVEIKPADFQKLVQSLTGKSTETKPELGKREFSSEKASIILPDESLDTETEILNGFPSLECRYKRTAGKEVNLRDESLIGFEELDKFINELITFPLLPLE